MDRYALKCDIEVCKKSNATSSCNTMAKACLDKHEPDMNRNLGPLAVERYLCDGLCDADHMCSIDENLRKVLEILRKEEICKKGEKSVH